MANEQTPPTFEVRSKPVRRHTRRTSRTQRWKPPPRPIQPTANLQVTLASATVSASVTTTGARLGMLAQTLGAATLAAGAGAGQIIATGQVPAYQQFSKNWRRSTRFRHGTSSMTWGVSSFPASSAYAVRALDAVTISGTASVAGVTASLARTLAAATVSATAQTTGSTSTLARTLAAVTVSATAVMTATRFATLARTLGAATGSGTAIVTEPPPPPVHIELKIAGNEHVFKRGSLVIQEVFGGQNTMQITVVSLTTGAQASLLNQEIIVRDTNAFRLFAGFIDSAIERGYGGEWTTAVEYDISATSYDTLATRRFITASYPAQTVLNRLLLIAQYLEPYGVEMYGTQEIGPTLPAVEYIDRQIIDILTETASLAASLTNQSWSWEITYYKLIRVFSVLGFGNQANFNIDDNSPYLIGDLTVEPTQNDRANYIIVRGGDGQKAISLERHYGDGVRRRWELNAPVVNHAGYIQVNGINDFRPLGIYGIDDMPYTYDPSTNEIVQRADQNVFFSFEFFELSYTGQYPISVVADGGANPADRIDRVYTEPEVFDPNILQGLANFYLSRDSSSHRIISYQTHTEIHPGQRQTLTDSRRGVVGLTVLPTEVEIRDAYENDTLLRTVKVIEGVRAGENWREMYLQWGSGTGTSSAATVLLTSGGGSAGGVGGTGTIGFIPKWFTFNSLENSIMSESSGTIIVGGTLAATVFTGGAWQGTPVALQYGGTGANLVANSGGIVYSTASAMAISAPGGTAGQILRSNITSAPTWSTATYPATAITTGAYLRADGTNWITSTLMLPNAAQVNRVVYATGLNTWGDSSNLLFSGSLLTVTGSVSISNFVGTPNYASQTTGWRIDSLGAADFRYLFVDEMHAKIFVAELEQALAGGQIIAKSVAMIAVSFTVPALGLSATLTVRDFASAPNVQVFESGDTIVLRNFTRTAGSLTISEAIGVVTGYADQSNGLQTWTFTRNTGANGGTMAGGSVIVVDSLALDYGVSGNGYYEVSAVDGIFGANSPYAQIVTWTTAPTSANKTLRTRFGNLRGITGVMNEYGMIAGTYAGTNGSYFRASNSVFELHGITAKWWASTTEVVRISPGGGSPFVGIGNPVPTAYTNPGLFLGWVAAVGKPRVSFLADASNYFLYDGDKIMWRAANTTLDASGTLTATNVNLTGSITALSGTIGDWFIGPDYLTDNNSPNSIIISAGVTFGPTIFASMGNVSAGPHVGIHAGSFLTDIGFWAGVPYYQKPAAPFRVTLGGHVTATTLDLVGNLTLGTAGAIKSGATAYLTGTGYWLAHNNGSPQFRVGNPATNYISWDQTSGSVFLNQDNVHIDDTGIHLDPGEIHTNLASAYTYTVTYGRMGIFPAVSFDVQRDIFIENFMDTNFSQEILSVRMNAETLNYKAELICYADDQNNYSRISFDADSYHFVAVPGSGTGTDLIVDGNGFILLKSSDERLKARIEPFVLGMDALRSVDPIRFQSKDGGPMTAGFSAQNIFPIIPEAVPRHPDGFYGLNTDVLLAVVVNALREIDRRLSQLES